METYMAFDEEHAPELVRLLEETSGFYASMPRGRTPQFILCKVHRRPSGLRVKIVIATSPPLADLDQALSESARRNAIQKREPSFEEFLQALVVDTESVSAHAHVRFEYSTEKFESLLVLPAQPPSLNLPFDQITGYRVAKLGDDNQPDYEVVVSYMPPDVLLHEVIFEEKVNTSRSFLASLLSSASSISTKLLEEKSNDN